MGNQLSGVAPSHPLSAENYLADLSSRSKELEFKKNLGSTRFLKVVMCLSEKGPVVVKIFVIQDPTLPLLEEKIKIDEIANKLLPSYNCLPYKRVELTERVAFIMRPYLKISLYDRISTRPFLAPIEKKWLAFQLLSALEQCHRQKIYHGDIKLENILVTSWSWLILTDFASYKPVLLPEDNPTHFTYFFDTSRRRPPQEDEAFLTPEMDMFSLGCVLAELFTEGLCPFNLMQLLQYRSNHYYPTEVLDKITDSRARSMVEQMIKKDPSERGSAEAYLKEERGNLFPNYFYDYFVKIKESLPHLIEALELKKMYDSSRHIEEADEKNTDKSSQNESIVVVISLIASCVRALQYPSSKLTTLELFKGLSEYAPNDILLDRILPYIFNLMKDSEPRVRAESIYTLAHCLKLVNAVPRSEYNIFPEYILPPLNEISSDPAVIVRQADASNISTIADAALKFLIYCSEHCPDYSPDTQIDSLHDIIQQKLAKMFSDPSNIVKRALIENNLGLLCKFFGKEKANDILFSHLITFLNEKRDFHLRISFYNNITEIATFMGSHSHEILKPLFLQGLSDTEEGVITAAIDNMTKLTEKGIFPNHVLCEIVHDAAPLFLHPNRWIKLAMVGLIVAVSKRVEYMDVITTLALTIFPYYKEKSFQFEERVILSRLNDPLPRSVYDSLVKCNCLEDILKILEDVPKRQMSVYDLKNLFEEKSRAREVTPSEPNLKKKENKIEMVIRLLLASGLTNEMVPNIIHMKDHLTKVNRHKETLPNPQPKQRPDHLIP
ncbi:Phosphoinositide 3-kinase regulatory subunit 4 [Armadillidium nasatum]|uniref:Phosphoinositide 3-kinase regulatory subunit 4 n=1 Tax=Armadillidium nasatum TaxID=96803 RepID=A0A5N5T7M8_9CRUS|nr:Phosphoinositide 3-kinase regulatory subunit 4 [Armadillidium nasatum]